MEQAAPPPVVVVQRDAHRLFGPGRSPPVDEHHEAPCVSIDCGLWVTELTSNAVMEVASEDDVGPPLWVHQ